MGNLLAERIAQNLYCPQPGFVGWSVAKFLRKRNTILEERAVQFCGLQDHHHVLEIGFGSGIGLKAAYQFIKGGTGKVYGVDISPRMVKAAEKLMKSEIAEGKVELFEAHANVLPYLDNSFDRVFHCNCYYFWKNRLSVMKEIQRVMKPQSFMITTLCLDRMKEARRKGYLKYGNIDVLEYMIQLEQAGFKNVKIEYLKFEQLEYQSIYAAVEKS